jgi:chromate reductase, NAD(P)H dehydrogenase (quinone)
MTEDVRVLGFSGSLRKGSYNTALLHAAVNFLPEHMTMEIFDIAPIPLYNEDIRAQGYPTPVQRFRDRILAADALLISTPEYNYSIPGVLKNAIDWASRPPNPLNDKPVAIMGATTGMFGTARAQMALRQVLVFSNMHPINKPEVLIMQAQNKLDAEGNIVDQPTRDFVRQLLEALYDWTLRLRKPEFHPNPDIDLSTVQRN